MAESLRIDAGVIQVLINDGPESISFNPSDVLFVERFYSMIREFEAKLQEYEVKASAIDGDTSVTANGIPTNMQARLEFLHTVCQFANTEIDFLFGDGTSRKLFNGAESLDMVEQFFTGLAPLIQKPRERAVSKYMPKK